MEHGGDIMKRSFAGLALLAAALVAVLPAQAQVPADYPNRPITFIVPIPPGGGFDSVARLIGEKLQRKWGQAVIVENRPGAASNIGADAVYRAAPDGYTLLVTPPAPLVVNQALYRKLTFDAHQFVPISVIAMTPNVLLVHPKVAATNVQELIALAKANPDKLNYASGGSGGTPHLTMELFKMMAGVKIFHVPYKGNVNAHVGLLGGQVDMMFGELSSALPAIRAHTARPFAVGSEKRSIFLPDVPAMSEVLPGFESMSWLGVVAPPGTPAALADKLSTAIVAAMNEPDVAKKLHDMSFEPMGTTPAGMKAFLADEEARWGKVVKATGATVE
jgi:tripartite-type tricarboxylate transporter receptor subunit TctC